MPDSNFVQANFLGGEVSPFAQGRSELPSYRVAMNVCRNSFPIEEGAWLRRSGTRFASTTLNGEDGRVIPFPFEQSSPYLMEFTDGFLRMYAVATQTSGLSTALPADFRLVTTNDNQNVLSISTANPAVVQTASVHGWATGDQGEFLFASTVNSAFTPLLRSRTFKITVTDTTHFSLSDPISGATIDGSTLGWSTPTANTVIFVRNLALATPYTAGSWASVRKVQAETQALLLQGQTAPQNLNTTSLPTSSLFASFALTQAQFLDGPYLDPPTDGSTITPTTISTTGTISAAGTWLGLSSNGTIFVALQAFSTNAATSTDGISWTIRSLPSAPFWNASAWNGAVFCAISGGIGSDAAATSADGITWVARTLPAVAQWTDIAWNGTVFCAIALGTQAATSADGITWVSRTLPVSASWNSIAWNGTVFAAIAGGSSIAATSPDGITWTQRTLPTSDFWSDVAWNGSVFCAVSFGSINAATSTNGITWILRALPSAQNWSSITAGGSLFCVVSNSGFSATSSDGITWTARPLPVGFGATSIAWNGTVFAAVGSSALSVASATGVFSSTSLNFSALGSVNDGNGFSSTDIGRLIRLHSEPAQWLVGTTYAAGNAVKFGGVYYLALGATTGNQPDISPTKWTLSVVAATWTWGTIISVPQKNVINIAIQGANLLYILPISEWRLGVYSGTTGYPTCGTYFEGRIWLSGAIANRVDASKVNEISDGILNFEPTAVDGTVADNNAISYTFNSDDVNPIFWMIGSAPGIVAGTQAGEWLISAPTTGPITPTNIQAHQGTHYGCANVEPEATQLTISFVQRFNRKVLEYFPDALSGRYTAPNLSEFARHLTSSGIDEIRYQQELLPVIWARMGDGSLAGATYDRNSLFSSSPPKFVAWHRHDLGSGRIVKSIAVGPSEDGTLDSLAMVTNGDDDVRHVEFLSGIFDIGQTIVDGWFCDDAVVPSGGVISGKTLTFYGLWHLNGQTVAVWCGGVDLGDFAVSSGSVVVPIDNNVNELFTHAYLESISSDTAYGARATLIDGIYGRLTVPAVVGFTYTSQGQILRPDSVEQTHSQSGPGLSKTRRLHQFGALLDRTQGIKFGTDFTKMHTVQFKSPGGSVSLTNLQLFSGVYWAQVDDTWGYDSMLCWQITRPYPAAVVAINGFMESN